eukprot:scaffold78739_cov69-Phaeocystis_antarctica.AAC.3
MDEAPVGVRCVEVRVGVRLVEVRVRVKMRPANLREGGRRLRGPLGVLGRCLEERLGRLSRLEDGLARLAHVADLAVGVELRKQRAAQPHCRRRAVLGHRLTPVDHELRAARELRDEQLAHRVAADRRRTRRQVVPLHARAAGGRHRVRTHDTVEEASEQGVASGGGCGRRHGDGG